MPSARRAGVPPEVIAEWEADFKKKKADQKEKGVKRLPSGSVQYVYNGVTYTAKWTNQAKGAIGFPEAAYEARVEGARSRQGEQQKIKLSSIEQMMVNNMYEEAQRRGLQVDHRIPISAGGPSNAPWNLGLMTPEENLRKGSFQGADYRYEPLIQSGGGARLDVNAILTKSNMPALGGFQEEESKPMTLPGGSTFKPPQLEGMSEEYLPQDLPATPKEDLSKQVMQTALGIAGGFAYGVGQALNFAGGVVRFATGGDF
jgi:hypothetical protein